MFSVTAQDGLARCGSLLTRHATVSTPNAMLYTRRGGSMYLTPEMLAKLRPEAQLLQVNVMQFLEHPNAELLLKFGKSLHHFIGVPEWPLLASNRDATLVEYVANRPANNVSAYVNTHAGGTMVTPERYMQTVHAMQPELFVAMADEVVADVGKKKLAASVERTTKWLDACLELHAKWRQQQASAAATAQGSSDASAIAATPAAAGGAGAGAAAPALLAPIVGGINMAARERSAKEAAARQGVEGYALCGFGMGESPQQQAEAITTAVQQLPADKLRLAVGLGSIEEVVEAVARGVDLFDCSYPQAVTTGGYALCFPWDTDHAASLAAAAAAQVPAGATESGSAGAAAAAAAAASAAVGEGQSSGQSRGSGAAAAAAAAAAVDVGTDDTKLNLWSVQYRLDNGPLVPGCTCFCCANHSRAYLHHLLHTHEMLGGVLLEMHNSHWWLGFFGAMQSAIQKGGWAAYQQWVLQRRVARGQGQAQQQQPTAVS